jgi:hypothetical protein
MSTDHRFPFTYACDHLRQAVGSDYGKGLISRAAASVAMAEIAKALGMESHEIAGALCRISGDAEQDTLQLIAQSYERACHAGRPPAAERDSAVRVEAIAISLGSGELEWLIEGGAEALASGQILMVSDTEITDDDGAGVVYTSPPAAEPPVSDVQIALGLLDEGRPTEAATMLRYALKSAGAAEQAEALKAENERLKGKMKDLEDYLHEAREQRDDYMAERDKLLSEGVAEFQAMRRDAVRLQILLKTLRAAKPLWVRVEKNSLTRAAVYPADEIDAAIASAEGGM